MSTDGENPTRWYQRSAVTQQPQDPPPEPRAGQTGDAAGTPGSHPAKWGPTGGGASTLYYPGALSALADTIDGSVLGELNAGLAELHWSIRRGDALRGGGEVTLVLSAAEGEPDAWQALQRLHALRGTPALSPAATAAVDGLALRRLYFVGMPDSINSMPARDWHAGTAREAITVVTPPPTRSHPDHVPGGRRPVVAVIDSGIGHHPWLAGAQDDAFWIDAGTLGWTGAPPGPAPDRTDDNAGPPGGVLEKHAGHGTFIAGLVRQIAPDARVLSLHAMSSDGTLDEVVVLDALGWLLERARCASDGGDDAAFVDVVNLSFGYYEDLPADIRYTQELGQILGDLGSLGVQVVASAGNDSTARPVFPAAFADPAYGTKPAIPLISVGALNPDGSHADYSNYDPSWPQHWAPGTAVTSTMPHFGVPPGPVTATYDPDNLVGGFALWGGTSFAAGIVSARVARALSDGVADDELRNVSSEAACRRARRAAAKL